MDPSTGARLLADLRAIFAETDADRLFSARIVEQLNVLEEAPWSGWHKGAGFKTRDLAVHLREFGVRSRTVRVGGDTAKGYLHDDLDGTSPAISPK